MCLPIAWQDERLCLNDSQSKARESIISLIHGRLLSHLAVRTLSSRWYKADLCMSVEKPANKKLPGQIARNFIEGSHNFQLLSVQHTHISRVTYCRRSLGVKFSMI
jgi:hypothetical protein